jgi:hypothetical protein
MLRTEGIKSSIRKSAWVLNQLFWSQLKLPWLAPTDLHLRPKGEVWCR